MAIAQIVRSLPLCKTHLRPSSILAPLMILILNIMDMPTLNLIGQDRPRLIQTVLAKPVITERLFEMGIVPGEMIEVVMKSFVGGPVIIKIHGTHIALRTEEAACILLKTF